MYLRRLPGSCHTVSFEILHTLTFGETQYYFTNIQFEMHCNTNAWTSNKTFVKCTPIIIITNNRSAMHDDVIKWKHFPRYWPFVWGIHRSRVKSPHKGQWRRALMFNLICARINGWINNHEAGALRRRRVHNDVIVMVLVEVWCPTGYKPRWQLIMTMIYPRYMDVVVRLQSILACSNVHIHQLIIV